VITAKHERLLELARAQLLEGEYTFSSGTKSNYYLDGRMITFSSEGALLVGELVWEAIENLPLVAIGGPALGAVPIVSATQVVARLQGRDLPGFVVREATKEHGTQKSVEGILPFQGGVAIVEDAVSTGGSVFRAIHAAEEAGCNVLRVIALLDWQLGGSTELRERGYDFRPLLVGDLSTGMLSITPERPL